MLVELAVDVVLSSFVAALSIWLSSSAFFFSSSAGARRRCLGLLDLAGRAWSARSCSFLRAREQLVAPRDQLLLRLERGGIGRRVASSPLLLQPAAAARKAKETRAPQRIPAIVRDPPALPIFGRTVARMLLYHDPRAPNPRRVRIFLAEKDVAYDTIEVLIANSAAPDARVPAQEPDRAVARARARRTAGSCASRWRSAATSRRLYPEPNLFGADPWERAQIEMWNRHAELELLWPISQVFRNTHTFWVGRIKQAPEFGEIMRELARRRASTGSTASSRKRPYIAGERFTVADITALCAIDFGKVSNIRINADDAPAPRGVARARQRAPELTKA